MLLSADHTTRGAYEQRMARTEAGTFAGPGSCRARAGALARTPAQSEPEREAETV